MRRFGAFELDEAARSLTLRGRAVDVQPKVFDLLVYLLDNAGRVTPKSELMDRLWPNVTVTEASLQRAASLLRRALREGGMGGALKSFAGLGYRLAIDRPDLQGVLPAGAAPAVNAQARAAREAAEARDWAQAAAGFAAADAQGALAADDRELWALAAECLGRPADAAPILRHAIESYEAAAHTEAAARCAATLAKIHLERGEVSVARGWLARAASLLGEAEAGEAFAYMLWMQSRFAAFEGDPGEALRLAQRAFGAATAAGSLRLRALTLAYLGFYNISLGNMRAGLEQQDHAAAMAMSSPVDPIVGGLIYCNILWSCRAHADWARASQWTDGFEAWCSANFASVTPACQLHRAEVLGAKGTLAEALERVEAAIAGLPRAEPWALGDAHRVRGDIRAAIGDLAGARADYAAAYAAGWDGEPGAALLLHEAGDTDGALAALDRVLANESWFGLQRRGWILAHKARLCALSGREAAARDCLATLRAEFDGWPSAAIRALALEAQAHLPPGARDPSAIQCLNLARQLWTSIGAEYHAARVRLALAQLLEAGGDRAGAAVEAACARDSAAQVGAAALRARAEALSARVDAGGALG
ncbi:MAG: winged helix-turn-helix domain-containing protein [Hyphomonadaceae bacterium]